MLARHLHFRFRGRRFKNLNAARIHKHFGLKEFFFYGVTGGLLTSLESPLAAIRDLVNPIPGFLTDRCVHWGLP